MDLHVDPKFKIFFNQLSQVFEISFSICSSRRVPGFEGNLNTTHRDPNLTAEHPIKELC